MTIQTEKSAIFFIFEYLYTNGLDSQRTGKAQDAHNQLQTQFSEISKRDLESLTHRNPGAFPIDKILLLETPSGEKKSVAALWGRWDLKDPHTDSICGFYFGLWSNQRGFDGEGEGEGEGEEVENPVVFYGYRFESPEIKGDDHKFYHSQPCLSMNEKDQKVFNALPMSHRMPTFPLPARSSVELLFCKVLAIYGLVKLDQLIEAIDQNPSARRNPSFSDRKEFREKVSA